MRSEPFVLLALALTATAAGATSRADFVYRNSEPNGSGMNYRLFVPPQYDVGQNWPVILFLHGLGETGTDNEAQLDNRANGAMDLVDGTNLALSPSFMVAPQTPVSNWGDAVRQSQLTDILNDLEAEFAIDPDRIYVTGLSMGGNGTWATVATAPGRYAAAVPLCGWANQASAPSLIQLPIWNFHAANDPTVGVAGSRNMIAALRAAGGDPIYTEYATGGHGIWNVTYALPQLFTWLSSQRRGGAGNLPAAPFLRIEEPTIEPLWLTAASDPLDLAGTLASAGTGVTSIVWTSTAGGSGAVLGVEEWTAGEIPLSAGTTTLRVLATGPSEHLPWSGVRTWSDTLRVVVSAPPPLPCTVVVAVDSGGDEYVATDGTVFDSDSLFAGGALQTSNRAIAGTLDDDLFNAWRFGAFSYLAPVPPGRYRVDLYFAETYHTGPGARLFDLELEGTPVEEDLDIAAVVGVDTALSREHEADVVDGELEIRLLAGAAGNPRLDAFRVTYLGPPTAIFVDGFENAGTNRWSVAMPLRWVESIRGTR